MMNQRGSINAIIVIGLALIGLTVTAVVLQTLKLHQERLDRTVAERKRSLLEGEVGNLTLISSLSPTACQERLRVSLRNAKEKAPAQLRSRDGAIIPYVGARETDQIVNATYEIKRKSNCLGAACVYEGKLIVDVPKTKWAMMMKPISTPKLFVKTNAKGEVASCSFEQWNLADICTNIGGRYDSKKRGNCALPQLQDARCPAGQAARGIIDGRLACETLSPIAKI